MMDFNFLSNPMMFMVFMGGMGIFNILLAIWVYNDAMNQNIPNASLWAAIALITSFLGTIIYFLFKPTNFSRIKANGIYINLNQPNNRNNPNEIYSKTSNLFCSSCGAKNELDSKYCVSCGVKI